MAIVHFDADASTDHLVSTLEKDGVVVVDGLADYELMDRVANELSLWLNRPVDQSPLGNNAFTGMRTLRTSGLIGKSRACGSLAISPLVLNVMDRVLGPQCSTFQLSFTQAIKIGRGETAQAIHRDTTMYPFRRPGPECFVNCIWALSDFTKENGCTRFHVGSHHWDDERFPTNSDPLDFAEMSKGSVVIYYGSIYHGGGANTTADQDRTGIALAYTLGWLRQEENQYLAVPPSLACTLPVELQRLIGYSEHFPFLGWYEGQDPSISSGKHLRKVYTTALEGRGVSPTQEAVQTYWKNLGKK